MFDYCTQNWKPVDATWLTIHLLNPLGKIYNLKMDNGQEIVKYAVLLSQLKLSVVNLLRCHPPNKWDLYSGWQKLYLAVAEILGHGFRFLKENGKPDFWVFVQGLSWLQPILAASPSFFGHPHTSSLVHSPIRHADKAMSWLYSSLDSHTLSEKLSWLLSDHEHLVSCYNSTAFLRQVQYSEATLICLQALEKQQISLMAKIDPHLYADKKIITKKHRRCLSYPDPNTSDDKIWAAKNLKVQIEENEISCSSPPISEVCSDLTNSSSQPKAIVARVHDKLISSIFESTASEKQTKNFVQEKMLKKCFSCSDVYILFHKRTALSKSFPCEQKVRRLSFTESVFFPPEQSCTEDCNFSDVLAVKYDKIKSNTKIRQNNVNEAPNSAGENEKVDPKKHSGKIRRRRASFFKLPFRFWEESDDDESICSEDSRTLLHTNASIAISSRKSFIDNVGNITLPLSTGNFPKPSPGQSIISFLTSGVFTQMNAELDRENAHFHISEALIAALEQVKFNQQIKQCDDLIEESDEEINHLKNIIKIKRRQRENLKCASIINENENTDNTTTTTDQSVNSLSSSSAYSTSDNVSTDQEGDVDVKINSGFSVSKLSLFSDEMNEYGSDISASAENVAISLLRRFKENQLPAASDIEWLVSERDAPQEILPLPSSIQVDDPSDRYDKSTLLRGTTEWAPPRPQIIFTSHLPLSRRAIMEKQMNRCAGCGTVVAPKYVSKFRYCEYLGRYFCTGCHSEQVTIIPGKVLQKWDFSRYPVSNFSYRLLDQMNTDPLFNVIDLKPELYCRVRDLQKVRLLRIALFYLKDFIFTCKYAERLKEMIMEEPSHVYSDPDNYSMADFVRVKNNKLYKSLTVIIKDCENHVKNCTLCQARGFMCEICKKQESIFPWQLDKVIQCKKCGSCHHIKCYQHKMTCPKCIRINYRNELNKIGIVQAVGS